MAVESVHSVSPIQCRLLKRLLRAARLGGRAENGRRGWSRHPCPPPLESRLVVLWHAVTEGIAGDEVDAQPKTEVGFCRPSKRASHRCRMDARAQGEHNTRLRSHPRPLTAPLRPHRLAPGATQLLGLVHHARQPPPQGQHARQRLLAISGGMRQGLALVCQRREGLVDALPPRSPTPQAGIPVPLAHAPVRPPAQVLTLVRATLPRRVAMAPHGWVRGIPRQSMRQAEAMEHPCGVVVSRISGDTAGVRRCLDPQEGTCDKTSFALSSACCIAVPSFCTGSSTLEIAPSHSSNHRALILPHGLHTASGLVFLAMGHLPGGCGGPWALPPQVPVLAIYGTALL